MVKRLVKFFVDRFGSKHSNSGLVLNSHQSCVECREFITKRVNTMEDIILVDFLITPGDLSKPETVPVVNIILFPEECSKIAKEFWQHTGLGVSSRFAEYCLVKLHLHFPKIEDTPKKVIKQIHLEHEVAIRLKEDDINEYDFVEERYGRNLSVDLAIEAKRILRKRIAGSIGQSNQTVDSSHKVINRGILDHENVILFPTGMTSIYFAHKITTGIFPNLKTVQFGFPYLDTLKLQQKFGQGCILFGHGDCDDLTKLVDLLKITNISGLFCEFPSNPLLKSPPLKELWKLANDYGFLLIVDETIGNFVNTNVLPYCHLVVSSLTKIFSGDSNVMGGSLVVNPKSNFANQIKVYINDNYKDYLFYEDAIFLERNSREFINRIISINQSTEALCDLLKEHPLGNDYINQSRKSFTQNIQHLNCTKMSGQTLKAMGACFQLF
jgi:cystathionine gamma-synthase